VYVCFYVFNVLLQILDDGRVTDSQVRVCVYVCFYVFNVLLQILDDGRVTDSQVRVCVCVFLCVQRAAPNPG